MYLVQKANYGEFTEMSAATETEGLYSSYLKACDAANKLISKYSRMLKKDVGFTGFFEENTADAQEVQWCTLYAKENNNKNYIEIVIEPINICE